ncbi:hypothetical protein [Desulfogranum marinum]|uniref:hypothetical protein n=1 Tax=Desulfogranum marinum TaxID=453220 RepID=UPI0029C63CF1|nr:hypothetical protein [Desulfogranum marinum]
MNQTSPVTIIDAIMGEGKSTYAIKKINDNPSQKYIILTPLNSEVTRYKEGISADYDGLRNNVVALDEDKSESKSYRFMEALRDGKTIIATHSLFNDHLDNHCIQEIAQDGEYELILDETMTMVTEKIISEPDVNSLITSEWIEVTPTDIDGLDIMKVTEKGTDYHGAHKLFMNAVDSRRVYRINKTTVIFIVPPGRLTAFKQVNILTYLFDGSKTHGWLKLFKLDINHLKLLRDGSGHRVEQHDLKYSGNSFKGCIKIFNDTKLNKVGEKTRGGREYPLSHRWYDKKRKGYRKGDRSPLDTLRKNVLNYYKNKTRAKQEDILWTCPKDYQELLSDRYFDPTGINTWLASNTRATNDYADRSILAYLVDVHQRPSITDFFSQHGIKINAERYALSTLIQWIWRSAIRKGGSVTIYLPSKRMRGVLEEWLK